MSKLPVTDLLIHGRYLFAADAAKNTNLSALFREHVPGISFFKFLFRLEFLGFLNELFSVIVQLLFFFSSVYHESFERFLLF